VASSLRKAHPKIEIKALPAYDFAVLFTAADLQKGIYDKVKHLDISILVNNAVYAEAKPFEELSLSQVHQMMAYNCYTVTLLTKLFLENFKARWAAKKIRSLIVNTSAGASIAPMPYLQMFSATKIFCNYLTEGLGFELAEFGIDVMGIKSFGLQPEDKEETRLLDSKTRLIPRESLYKQLMGVTAT